MRGRDHHAEIGAQRARQHGDGRRRHRAELEDVHAHGQEARLQRALDHVARQARILADHDTVAMSARGEDLAGGHADLHGDLGRHRKLVGFPTDPIRSKQAACHVCSFPLRLAARIARRNSLTVDITAVRASSRGAPGRLDRGRRSVKDAFQAGVSQGACRSVGWAGEDLGEVGWICGKLTISSALQGDIGGRDIPYRRREPQGRRRQVDCRRHAGTRPRRLGRRARAGDRPRCAVQHLADPARRRGLAGGQRSGRPSPTTSSTSSTARTRAARLPAHGVGDVRMPMAGTPSISLLPGSLLLEDVQGELYMKQARRPRPRGAAQVRSKIERLLAASAPTSTSSFWTARRGCRSRRFRR